MGGPSKNRRATHFEASPNTQRYRRGLLAPVLCVIYFCWSRYPLFGVASKETTTFRGVACFEKRGAGNLSGIQTEGLEDQSDPSPACCFPCPTPAPRGAGAAATMPRPSSSAMEIPARRPRAPAWMFTSEPRKQGNARGKKYNQGKYRGNTRETKGNTRETKARQVQGKNKRNTRETKTSTREIQGKTRELQGT